MAGAIDVKLEIKGVKETQTLLKRVGLDVNDLDDAMSDVGDRAIRIFGGQVFASQGGFIGQTWPRLSPRYAVQKAKKYAGRPPLIATGRMQSSFDKDVRSTSVTIGNKSPYFKYHQSTAPRRRLPRRAMIGIWRGAQDEVTQIVASALSRKIKRSAG